MRTGIHALKNAKFQLKKIHSIANVRRIQREKLGVFEKKDYNPFIRRNFFFEKIITITLVLIKKMIMSG